MKYCILHTKNRKSPDGQSLLEIIIAIGIFVLIASNIIVLSLASLGSHLRDKEKFQADLYLQQAFEAVRSIRDFNFQDLGNGTYGLSRGSGYWQLSGSSDVQGQFTRSVVVADVQRNASCVIVGSGGDVDASSKKVTVNIAWAYETGNATSISATQYLHRTNNLTQCGMAGNLSIDVSDAEIDTNQRDLEDIDLRNTGSTHVTIDKIKISWTNGGLVEQVRMGGTFVWRYDFEGTPDGKQPSGIELDMDNYTILAGSTVSLDRIRFDGNMNGTSFTIEFIMTDGTRVSASAL